jgi:hypothetical protein
MSKTPSSKTQALPGKRPSPPQQAAELQEKRCDPALRLIEIRPGLFLNVDQIVSVRTLPAEEDKAYAILQLSNGDMLNLTCGEFTLITGEDPRLPPVRPETAAAKQDQGRSAR